MEVSQSHRCQSMMLVIFRSIQIQCLIDSTLIVVILRVFCDAYVHHEVRSSCLHVVECSISSLDFIFCLFIENRFSRVYKYLDKYTCNYV